MKHDNIKKKNVIKEVKDDLKKMVSNQKKREKVDSNIVSNLLLGGVVIIIIFAQHDTIEEFEKRLQEVEHEPFFFLSYLYISILSPNIQFNIVINITNQTRTELFENWVL